MRKANRMSLAILIVVCCLVPVRSDEPQPQPAPPPAPQGQQPAQPPQKPAKPQVQRITQLGQGAPGALPSTVPGRIAIATKLSEADVAKMMTALGPAIRDLLAEGNTVEIPNLGLFRVVRIPEHRDMVNGRPATIAGSNYVEFVPSGGLVGAANRGGAKPAETVPPFEYNPLPDQTKGLKTGGTRAPNSRTP
jgi:nucleoid DNA-binding protein